MKRKLLTYLFPLTAVVCAVFLLAREVASVPGSSNSAMTCQSYGKAKLLKASAKAVSDPGPISASSAPGPDAISSPEMVWVPGGEFSMGSDDAMFQDSQPWHRVYVDGFWMDKTAVTNEQFANFVRASGYKTIAERKPDPKDYPGASPEKLVSGSLVFAPPRQSVPLQSLYQWWSYVPGANWRHPEGPDSDIRNRKTHPAVQLAYEDAVTYCSWDGGRLPTEAEFEFAARGGLDRKPYVWGDSFKPNGKFMANTFQGHFPDRGTAEDGYASTAPVASFPANGYGLYDMAGNVWEWTSDWYRPDYYQTLAATQAVVKNPQGPVDSFDPREPGIPKRVQRGGSFLCTDQYCSRYMVGARGKGAVDSGTNHVGFRCVRN